MVNRLNLLHDSSSLTSKIHMSSQKLPTGKHFKEPFNCYTIKSIVSSSITYM